MERDFMELVNANRALIFKVCNLYCADAESRHDLFQEIVLQLWRSFARFRKDSSGSTWVYRVALNTAISNFRKETRKPEKSSISLAELDIPDLTGHLSRQEELNSLYAAIQLLTEIEKAIILLYLDEKTYEEISDIVGISISNVGVRLNRIKNKLTQLVKNK